MWRLQGFSSSSDGDGFHFPGFCTIADRHRPHPDIDFRVDPDSNGERSGAGSAVSGELGTCSTSSSREEFAGLISHNVVRPKEVEPMSAAKPQRARKVSSVARPQTQPKPTILIAEDSTDGREMMELLLALKGYQVVGVENGLEAVEVALAKSPDLILIDLELPKLDGLGVTRNLRRHPKLRKTPIIIVSGHDPAKHRQSAIDAGCTDYLLKPIDFDLLDTILKTTVPLVS
jgi:CheY-like chemotaxis protein